jgi:hypothetical protein
VTDVNPAFDELPMPALTDVGLLTLRLIDMLDTWVQDYREPFDPSHSTIFCVTSAFTMPWLGLPALHLATRIWTWITAIDDAADMFFTGAELDRSVQRCRDVLDGGQPDSSDQLATCLAEIRDDLATHPTFAALAPLWRDSVDRLMVSMQYERHAADSWRAGGPAPDLTEYLDHASHTIGIRMYMVSVWATMNESDLPADLEELLLAEKDSALAIRFGNDLRGVSREQEHGTLNALTLGMTPQQVTAAIREHAALCHRRLEPLSHLASAVALHRQTTWATRMYDRIDFRVPGTWVTAPPITDREVPAGLPKDEPEVPGTSSEVC